MNDLCGKRHNPRSMDKCQKTSADCKRDEKAARAKSRLSRRPALERLERRGDIHNDCEKGPNREHGPRQREVHEVLQARKRNPIRTESTKQMERTAFLHGLKAERMHRMADAALLTDRPDPYWCQTCDKRFETFEEAWNALTVSHIEPRNDTASRYERRREPDFRGDDPSNVLLECVPCNQAREPQPEWATS